MKAQDITRFWSKVKKTRKCWEWTACLSSDGYGVFRVRNKNKRAHRVAYELCVGPIPASKCVLHVCDNTKCVKPTHLWLGTNADNVHDAMQKGRFKAWAIPLKCRARGERHGMSKLTEHIVRKIKQRYKDGERQTDIAEDYGITRHTVWNVVHHRTWQHIK